MAVILDPGNNPDFSPPPDPGQGPVYLPNVTALRGVNGLETVITLNSITLNTLVEFTVGSDLQFFKLLPGPADGSILNIEVAPLDYNAVTNDVHWRLVGGFGVSLMTSARVFKSSNTSIPNNVNTALVFDTARFNSGEWDDTVNPGRITCLVDGVYSISGSVSFAAFAGGVRKVSIRKNGSTEIASQKPVGTPVSSGAANPVDLTVTTIAKLVAGEYVELVVLQSSGGALDVLSGAQYSPEFSAVRLSSLRPVDFTGTPPPPEPAPIPIITGDKVVDLSFESIGWYRIWQGPYPSSGNFELERLLQGDGQTSDTLIDFTIIGGTPEGVITIKRNSIPAVTSPSIDAVRVSHLASAAEAYVDVHITRAGLWQLTHKSNDDNFLTAPYVVEDDLLTPGLVDAVFTYSLKPNVTGGSGAFDVTQINSGDQLLLKPQADSWAAWTGTASRVTRNADAPPTLTQVAQGFKALIDDLIEMGILRIGLPSGITYADMLNMSASVITEGLVASVNDIFRVSVAPDTTAQGIYVPFGALNAHTRYFLQGYSWSTANGRCEWSTFWSTWTIYNEAGTRLYHSGAAEANPWSVVQWKDEAAANVAVTTIGPNIAMTYNELTDTHTAMDVKGTTGTAWDGFYLRVADVNGKRSYKLVGTGTNNKRFEWSGTVWELKDDSSTYASSPDAVSYPDKVTAWGVSGTDSVPSILGLAATDLMSGCLLGGDTTYDGRYVPIKGAYNNLGGRKLIYRRVDGVYYLENDLIKWSLLDGVSGTVLFSSEGNGTFPWNVAWPSMTVTAQQTKVASPGWTANTQFPNLNTTGQWHL